MRQLSPKRARVQGFSLVEVLVTMAVSAVALLGLAGMQLQGERLQSLASLRGTAALLASDMADRIRANPSGASSLAAYRFTVSYQGTEPSAPDCGNNCNATQVAQRDLYEWWTNDLSRQLPGAWFYITAVSGAYQLSVIWREPDQEAAASTTVASTFTCPDTALSGAAADVETDKLRCYTITVWP